MGDPVSGARRNQLAQSNSPYLLLHAENPVDWYPWGEEAFERARREDRPIFLSVGYTACHWCHVMERESFADREVARVLNEQFVNVKVDREERPDLDELYMTATQILSGQGGWPNSVFLTPKLEPFFAGTYFPPVDREGRPGLITVARALGSAWRERRSDVEEQAAEVMRALREHFAEGAAAVGPLDLEPILRRCLEELQRRLDARNGGFGGAPKFPVPPVLALLEDAGGRSRRALDMLDLTLRQMVRGGLFDQVSGGFHRYSTDAAWRVPHFEKMLYDNALLLEVYARASHRTGDLELLRGAEMTARFLLEELRSPEGGFWSALDADSDGREGAFYVWTYDELEEALGAEDAIFLAPILGFDGEAFFEDRHYVLHWPRPLWALAKERRREPLELLRDVESVLERLREARARRPRPLTDDKILLDWNGFAIAALASAGELLSRPDWVSAASRAATFAVGAFRRSDGGWHHVWRAGKSSVPAMLADVASLARGLLSLARATGNGTWIERASEVADWMHGEFDSTTGGYFSARASSDLLIRNKEILDGPTPSGNALALEVLGGLWQLTGLERWGERFERVLRGVQPLVERLPNAAASVLRVWLRAPAGWPVGSQSGGVSSSARVSPLATTPEQPGLEFEVLEILEKPSALEARCELRAAAGWSFEEFGPGKRLSWSARHSEEVALAEEPSAPERLRFRLQWPAASLESLAGFEGIVRLCGQGRCLPDRRVPLGDLLRQTLSGNASE